MPSQMFPLPILVEILINGSWVDITKFVYQRDPLTMTGGRTDMGDSNTPSQLTLTLNNRDGRFTPNYASGAYYPYLQAEVQIRVSLVNAVSYSGNTYTGYRFWGKVTAWPPQSQSSDTAGDSGLTDVFCPITASGPLRQLKTGGGKGSALDRYYSMLTGSYAPIAYWPCEEDPYATTIGAGINSGLNMVVVGSPKWKADHSFNGSSPMAQMNRSTWTGTTGAFSTSGNDIFSAPGTYPWVASTSTVDCRVWSGGGGATKGSEGNGGGTAGGGSAMGREPALAVTVGKQYLVVVGAGGAAGLWNVGGSVGGTSQFQGDAVLVTANPGGGGGPNGTLGGGAGAAGSNTDAFKGGSGGANPSGFNGGAGGGGSAGLSAAGNNGSNPSTGSGGAGGAAVSGGGAGGAGDYNGPGGIPGGNPGAGGGAGWANQSQHTNGASGAPGQVQLVYTPSGGGTTPPNIVVRFLMKVPPHGGNHNKVVMRFFTGSGTIYRCDVQYARGGQLALIGYNSSGTQLFNSGAQGWNLDGQPVMVSVELTQNGANVGWSFCSIIPGQNGVIGRASGTYNTATLGSVTSVVAGPNADITTTCIGHISVQYAYIPLWQVSQAINGHDTEVGIDRLMRIANEEAMGNLVQYNEGADHWGFESGTESWVGTNATLTSSTVSVPGLYPGFMPPGEMISQVGYWGWPPEGTHSLLITASGAGAIAARSPSGTSGQPCLPGEQVSANFDIYTPAAVTGLSCNIDFYTSAGTYVSSASTALDSPTTAGEIQTIKVVIANIPATAAFFAVSVTSSGTLALNTLVYVDHVRVHPQMGVQTAKRVHELVEEMEDLDQGLLKEAKKLWGLGYRTRISLINQSPAVTIDFSQAAVSYPLVPSIDVTKVANDITVKRHKGSKVEVQLLNGQKSVLEPPGGVGRKKKEIKVVAQTDAQLLALAAHLLILGTTQDVRVPTVTITMDRAAAPGSGLSAIMSAVAGVEIGDFVEFINMPFWFPASPLKQLVIGYTEVLNPSVRDQTVAWQIIWNCTPEIPYELTATSIHRW